MAYPRAILASGPPRAGPEGIWSSYAPIKTVRGRQYRVMPSLSLCPTAGTSDDYAFSCHLIDASKPKVYSYTIEWGRQTNPTPFHPPYPEMQRIIQEVTAALLAFCLNAQ